MGNEPLQQQPEPEKTNKVRRIFASMSIKEKKTLLLIGFFGMMLMFIINMLKIFF
jgi:hypothetical protein